MEMQLLSRDQLKITLTEEDLDKLGVTYDSLDYADPKTKKTILLLLGRAKRATGFDPQNTRLYIEVFPLEDGGCTIFFTTMKKDPLRMPSSIEPSLCEPVIFAFSELDILIEAACKLFRQYCHRIYKSSLYNLDGSYRLIIYPLDGADNVTVGFLCEYGQLVGEGAILTAFVEEHGQLIIADNAIDVLTKYLA